MVMHTIHWRERSSRAHASSHFALDHLNYEYTHREPGRTQSRGSRLGPCDVHALASRPTSIKHAEERRNGH